MSSSSAAAAAAASSDAASSAEFRSNAPNTTHPHRRITITKRRPVGKSSTSNNNRGDNYSSTLNNSRSDFTSSNNRRDFTQWFTLFVEAVHNYGDIAVLMNAQLVCRRVCLLMAQHRTFQTVFFERLVPRTPEGKQRLLLLKRQKEDSNKKNNNDCCCWTLDESKGTRDLPHVQPEEQQMLHLLFSSPSSPSSSLPQRRQHQHHQDPTDDHNNNNDDNGNDEHQTATNITTTINSSNESRQQQLLSRFGRAHPALSWKVICRRYDRQLRSVACRVSTPEFYRGVWRIPESAFWRRPHLSTMESPPFLLKPRLLSSGSKRAWSLRGGNDSSVMPHAVQQGFQLVLQRTCRADGNALGLFVQSLQSATGTIEGDSHEVFFTLATLDRSLDMCNEYEPLRRFTGQTKFTATHANSGFIFQSGKVTRHSDHNNSSALTPSAMTANPEVELLQQRVGWDSPEDIVIEVEVFSLGPGVIEPDQVLTYGAELAETLNLETTTQITPSMRSSIWRFLRGLTHQDPYSDGIMGRRKHLLRHLMPALLRDVAVVDDLDLVCNASGVLWNLTDVDVPPVRASQMKQLLDSLVMVHVAELFKKQEKRSEESLRVEFALITQSALVNDSAAASATTATAGREEQFERHRRAYELQRDRARRQYRYIAPSLLGSLWNLPQSAEGTYSLLGRSPDVVRFLLDMMQAEIACDPISADVTAESQQQQQLLSQEQLQSNPDPPVVSHLVACCHFVARCILYFNTSCWSTSTSDEEDQAEAAAAAEEEEGASERNRNLAVIRRILRERNAEQLLLRGVRTLRRHTRCVADLGVALFSRDYVMFFLPLLCDRRRATTACVAVGSFMSDCTYFFPANEQEFLAMMQQQRQQRQDQQQRQPRQQLDGAD